MDKVSELKWKLVSECSPHEVAMGFGNGFDAAIELGLPVKFAEWKDENWIEYEDFKGQYHEKLRVSRPKTITQLYDYWRENVYKPE